MSNNKYVQLSWNTFVFKLQQQVQGQGLHVGEPQDKHS